jgi:hypothetical protein
MKFDCCKSLIPKDAISVAYNVWGSGKRKTAAKLPLSKDKFT